jgi:HAD superfamily hydrolase (TIGR01509 family)
MSHSLADLHVILADRAHLLLDFDGPVCAVYAGVPAADVARKLRERVRAEFGVTISEDLDDPLDVLREVHARAEGSSIAANRMLTELEIAAVRTARPTPGAVELIAAARASGRTVTVVSNNSADAITLYCLDHGLGSQLSNIVGRDPNAALMKPNPHLVHVAIAQLTAESSQCVFVGDSPSDVIAGHMAGVPVIGYANKPGKSAWLEASGADAVTDALDHITAALTTNSEA